MICLLKRAQNGWGKEGRVMEIEEEKQNDRECENE